MARRTLARLSPSLLAIIVLLSLAPRSSAQPFSSWATFGITPGGYIRVPDSPSLDPVSAMTIESWVYLDSFNNSCVSLIGKNYTNNYWIGICPSGSPSVPTLRSYLRGTASQMTGGRLYAGQWNHVAVTWDGTTRRHYVNGDLKLESPDAGTLTPNNSELRIGSDVNWEFTPSVGLNEVRLWSVARTTAQLRATINTPIATAQPGLVSVWGPVYGGADALGANNGTIVGDVRSTGYSPANGCTSYDTVHCFGNRFQVRVEWRLADGTYGDGITVPEATADSGLFYFFSPTNWELLVKALDGCGINGRRWVFSAATTNVGYTLIVFDTKTAEVKRYINPLGVNAPAVNDTSAFGCP